MDGKRKSCERAIRCNKEHIMTIRELTKLSNGKELDIAYPIEIKDKQGNETYCEYSDGFWYKSEYDSNGNCTYFENSCGYWYKSEYDSNGNCTYYENSDKFWYKREYDSNGNETYFENSCGTKSRLRLSR